MTLLAPRTFDPPPLADATRAVWVRLGPATADDVDRFRAQVYRRAGRLWRAMGAIERRSASGDGMSPEALGEVWAWISTLAIVVGSPQDTTCAAYANRVAQLLTWTRATGRDHGALDVADFEAWIRELCLRRSNTTNSRVGKMAAVRKFYGWRFVNHLGEDRARYVPLPKTVRSLPVRYSTEALQRMFASAEKRSTLALQLRDKAIMLLLLASGLRCEELVNLNLSQIELRRNSGMVRVRGKGSKQRDIPIEGPVVPALTDWLGARETLGYPVDPESVFVVLHSASRGRRMEMRGVMLLIEHHARAAGLRKGQFGVHKFRVTYATALYDEGAGLEEIRMLLGHDSIETTRGYIAISNRARKTRLSAQTQHRALGKAGGGQPRWLSAALGELGHD